MPRWQVFQAFYLLAVVWWAAKDGEEETLGPWSASKHRKVNNLQYAGGFIKMKSKRSKCQIPGLPARCRQAEAAIRKESKRELVMDIEWFKENIKCCACGGTLETSELNVFVTEKLATWKCPVFGCFDMPDYGPRAVAIVCDKCLRKDTKVRYCIEWEDSAHLVKYHDIECLEDRIKSESQKKYYFGAMFRPGRKEETEPTNPKKTVATLCLQAPPSPGKEESEKMKNPEYFRLMKDGRFVGFKRVVTEFLSASCNAWQLDQIDHDPDETEKLSKPAMGIATYKRESITSSIQS